jgi:hypothetical protein
LVVVVAGRVVVGPPSEVAGQDAKLAGLDAALGGAEVVFVDYFPEPNPAGAATTRVLYDLVSALSGADVVAAQLSLFCPPSGGAVFPGAPACPVLIAAFQAKGLPIAAAFYQHQTAPTAWTTALLQAHDPAKVGTRKPVDAGEVACLHISYEDFSVRADQYTSAFAAGLAHSLGTPTETITVETVARSSVGTTCLYFSITVAADDQLPVEPFSTSTTSDYNLAILAASRGFRFLFVACAANLLGCPSTSSPPPPLKPLAETLAMYGLPVSSPVVSIAVAGESTAQFDAALFALFSQNLLSNISAAGAGGTPTLGAWPAVSNGSAAASYVVAGNTSAFTDEVVGFIIEAVASAASVPAAAVSVTVAPGGSGVYYNDELAAPPPPRPPQFRLLPLTQ